MISILHSNVKWNPKSGKQIFTSLAHIYIQINKKHKNYRLILFTNSCSRTKRNWQMNIVISMIMNDAIKRLALPYTRYTLDCPFWHDNDTLWIAPSDMTTLTKATYDQNPFKLLRFPALIVSVTTQQGWHTLAIAFSMNKTTKNTLHKNKQRTKAKLQRNGDQRRWLGGESLHEISPMENVFITRRPTWNISRSFM